MHDDKNYRQLRALIILLVLGGVGRGAWEAAHASPERNTAFHAPLQAAIDLQDVQAWPWSREPDAYPNGDRRRAVSDSTTLRTIPPEIITGDGSVLGSPLALNLPCGIREGNIGAKRAERSGIYDPTRKFTPKVRAERHVAADFHAEVGTPVYASAGGRVEEQIDNIYSTGGRALWICHDDECNVESRYLHLDRFAPGTAQGEMVRKGQLIGYVGDTGTCHMLVRLGKLPAETDCTDPHLHFEVRRNGSRVSPAGVFPQCQ